MHIPAWRRRPLVTLAGVLVLLAGLVAGCTDTVSGSGRTAAGVRPTATGSTPDRSGSSSSGPGSEGQTPHASPITFSDCSSVINISAVQLPAELERQLKIECGKLLVPLDYTDPQAQQISIEVIRLHYIPDRSPQGGLLLNPGGPGGSGLELALGIVSDPTVIKQLLPHFDLIGFDPRGVGLSTPVQCTTDQQKDQLNAFSPQILTAAGFQQAKQSAAQVARGCAQKYGSTLPFYNTVNTARDMDLIRQGIGDDRMNYLGFSYGTELGAQYAHLFPKLLRTFVLDGAVDPLTSGIRSFADQLGGFEKAFDQFAAYCATQCRQLGTPRQLVYQLRDKAIKTPISTGTSRPLTSNLLLTGVLQALYSKSLWPSLASALASAKSGDGSGLLRLADQYNERYSNGQYANVADANQVISCNDSTPGPTDAQIRATAKTWSTAYPMFGTWAAPSLFGCQAWQPKRTVPPKPTAPTSAVKILVVGNLHDPATPYQGAKDLARTLGNAELLSWDGEGHTSFLQGSACIDKYVSAYLVSQTLPPANLTCPA